MSRTQHILLLGVLGFIGLVDSLYLSYTVFSGGELICGIVEGCNAVAASPYSRVLGIPLAYAGVVYYLGTVFLAGILYYGWGSLRIVRVGSLLYTLLGALMSLYFLYVQVALIGAICLYCLLSAAITFILFAIGYVLYCEEVPPQVMISE